MEKHLESLSNKELISLLKKQQDQLLDKDKNLQDKEEKILSLESQIAYFKRRFFGQTRERFISKDQLSLPFEQTEQEKEKTQQLVEQKTEEAQQQEKKKNPNHKGRLILPDHLPVVEEVIEPDQDTTQMVRIGEEVTQVLDMKPGRLFIRKTIRPKYIDKSDHTTEQPTFIIADLKGRFIDKCKVSHTILATILVDKYKDHLPLYRQIQRYDRLGFKIPASSIDSWTSQSLIKLEPLYEALKASIISKGYLQADETTIKVLDSNKKGKTHLGYYWVYNDPLDNLTLFDYQPSRKKEAAKKVLSGFKGYLQTDGYAGYNLVAKNKEVQQLFCWAHARRKFETALNEDKAAAEKALTFIQGLYKVEAQAKEQSLTHSQRKELRLQYALPIINEMAKWLLAQNHLPKSLMRTAVQYAMNLWQGLCIYLYDGALQIDNNLVENSIRPVAIGRKNYLFAGSHQAAQRAAMIYSFFAICQKHQVNPQEWLEYVMDNIMDTKYSQLHRLFPQNFKKIQL